MSQGAYGKASAASLTPSPSMSPAGGAAQLGLVRSARRASACTSGSSLAKLRTARPPGACTGAVKRASASSSPWRSGAAPWPQVWKAASRSATS